MKEGSIRIRQLYGGKSRNTSSVLILMGLQFCWLVSNIMVPSYIRLSNIIVPSYSRLPNAGLRSESSQGVRDYQQVIVCNFFRKDIKSPLVIIRSSAQYYPVQQIGNRAQKNSAEILRVINPTMPRKGRRRVMKQQLSDDGYGRGHGIL